MIEKINYPQRMMMKILQRRPDDGDQEWEFMKWLNEWKDDEDFTKTYTKSTTKKDSICYLSFMS